MTKPQENKIQLKDNNYFDYLHNLRLFKKELSNVQNLDDIEILFPKIMNYIYTNDTLLYTYKEQLNIFLNKYAKNEEFESLYNNEYEKVKDIAVELAKHNNLELIYNNYRDVIFCPAKDERKIRCAIDMPLIYLFLSIALTSSELVQNKKTTYFQISDSLRDMYRHFNIKYRNIKIPQNIEFFVALKFSQMKIGAQYKRNYTIKNTVTYLITSMNYVLDTLQKIFIDKIDQEYFDKESIILYSENLLENNNKEHKLVYKNGKFYLNKQLLDLSDTLQGTLEKILAVSEDGYFLKYSELDKFEKDVIKQNKCLINKYVRKLINQDFLIFSKPLKNYTIAKNIKFSDNQTD